MKFIDTHIHLDGEEFVSDGDMVVERARAVGCSAMFVPAVDMKSISTVLSTCSRYPGYAYPMIGLHPEEVRSDWREVLETMRIRLAEDPSFIAVGEIGLDFYWSRDFEKEQLEAFEEQVRLSVDMRLPLMIHCRKAQNELVKILRRYEKGLVGGVFHCFTGNEKEAQELLSFKGFMLGIGGVLTFKNSHLSNVLSSSVPLNRVVLETDAPYMSPVPQRGKRNESAFIIHIIQKMSECYGVSVDDIGIQTTANAYDVFALAKH